MTVSIRKSMLSLAIIFTLAISQIFFSFAVQATETTFLDFEEGSETMIGDPINPDKTRIMVDPKDPTNKVYSVSSVGNTSVCATYTFSEAYTGKVIIDLDYYNYRTTTSRERSIRFYTGDEPFDGKANTFLFSLGTLTSAGIFAIRGTDYDTTIVAQPARWYHFTVVLDLDTGIMERWTIDGVDAIVDSTTGLPTTHTLNLGTKQKNLKHISLYNTNGASGSTIGDVALDNFKIRNAVTEANVDPLLLQEIEDQELSQNSSFELNLRNYFDDLNGDKLTYNKTLADAQIVNDIYTFTPTALGTFRETITASDGKGGTDAAVSFTIEVYDKYRINKRITFEDDELEALPTGFTHTYIGGGTSPSGYTKVIKDPHDSNNKVMTTRAVSGNTSTESKYMFKDILEGIIVVDYDFMNERPTSNTDGSVRFYNNGTYDYENYLFSLNNGVDTTNRLHVTVKNLTTATVTQIPTSVSIPANTWKHITAVIDTTNKTLTLYVDGILVPEVNNKVLEIGTRDFNIRHIAIGNRTAGTAKSLYLDNMFFKTADTGIPMLSLNQVKSQKAFLNMQKEIDFTNEFFDIGGKPITLNTDKGTFDGKVLKYTPTTLGTEEIIVTAQTSVDTITKKIILNVTMPRLVKVNTTLGGTVANVGNHIIDDGNTFSITATPDLGYEIEYIKLNGVPVVAYQASEYEYTTPQITNDTVIDVSFKQTISYPEVISVNTIYKEFYEGKPAAITFATARETIGEYELVEYGMVLSKTNVDPEIGQLGCIKVLADKGANILGQYGIRFVGSDILIGNTYFAKAYAIYSNGTDSIIVYGTANSFNFIL